jgi:L-threonylcarbamoyladenylate synthase
MDVNILNAISILNRGGIIIFPTDTAFGIGCRIDRLDAIERLFKIRKRPLVQAVPVLVSSLEMAKNYTTEISEEVTEKLIRPYWPGALTIVFNAQTSKVPQLVRGGTGTVGLRMPNNKDLLQIIEKVGVPILGPSANFHGELTPYSLEALNPKLTKLVDFVLEGKCELSEASTVIDTTQKPWKILRQGAINITIS